MTDELAGRLLGDDGLTARRSTFTRRDVLQAVAEAARDAQHVHAVERWVDAVLVQDEVVELAAVRGERQYTTRALLRTERELLERAEHRRRAGVAVASDGAVRAALDTRPALSEEQRELVRALAQEGDDVQVVRAAAGTGKTLALEAAAEAWRRSGIPVVGCALSARAACELRDQAGIDTTTIARLKRALRQRVALAEGAVLIVDEAGVVGTRDLAVLADAAERLRAKLVLVGDDRQLPEIEAGGAFRALAERLGAVELHEVKRQREEWDRGALTALRDGDVDRFVREYHDHGRLVAAPNARAAREALVADWWAAHERGAGALMIAHRRSGVADLNARARERMRQAGRLGADELRAGGRAYAVGDRVVATRNDRGIGVVNGEAGVVAAIANERLTVELDGHRQVELSARYVADCPDHGYAITAHRAQGATVDAAFVLGSDELYREWGYTALSRHRDTARFYVSASPAFLNEPPQALEAGADVTQRFADMLAESRAQHLALNGVKPDHHADRLADHLRREAARLAWVEQRLDALRDEQGDMRWYERDRRAEVAGQIECALQERRRSRVEVERLRRELEQRPPTREPRCWRASDPLAAVGPSPAERAREIARERRLERSLDRDVGLER